MHIVLRRRVVTIFTILSMFRVIIFHTFCNHEISVKLNFAKLALLEVRQREKSY